MRRLTVATIWIALMMSFLLFMLSLGFSQYRWTFVSVACLAGLVLVYGLFAVVSEERPVGTAIPTERGAMIIFMLLIPTITRSQDTRTDPGAPIRHITPGSILTTRRALMCTPGYSARTRSVSAKRKDSVYVRYHIADSLRKGYVIDHLVPIEGGGSNRITNLVAQDTASARKKDRVEAWMKHQICHEHEKVRPLQRAIARDWRALSLSIPKSFVARTSPD